MIIAVYFLMLVFSRFRPDEVFPKGILTAYMYFNLRAYILDLLW